MRWQPITPNHPSTPTLRHRWPHRMIDRNQEDRFPIPVGHTSLGNLRAVAHNLLPCPLAGSATAATTAMASAPAAAAGRRAARRATARIAGQRHGQERRVGWCPIGRPCGCWAGWEVTGRRSPWSTGRQVGRSPNRPVGRRAGRWWRIGIRPACSRWAQALLGVAGRGAPAQRVGVL